MPLIKRRPDISLYAPREVVAGRPLVLTTVLDCSAPLPVERIDVELIGSGVWHTSSQYGQHRNEVPFARYVAAVQDKPVELEPRRHELRSQFHLPASVAGSYVGRLLRIEWTARVHVDIPWWPDARAAFDLHVRSQADPAPSRQKVFVSTKGGPQGRKPYAEVALGSTEVEPGGRILGKVALGNTDANTYRGVQFALVGLETVRGVWSRHSEKNYTARWRIDTSAPGENEPIDFALRVPDRLPPGFSTQRFTLEWFLEVRLDVAWSIDPKLWIPIAIRNQPSELGDEIRAPLAVGSDRLAIVWAKAAEQTGFNYVGGELTRGIGQARASVRREHRGRRGIRLVGTSEYDDLHIGLHDESGAIRCRDEGQSAVLAEYTDPAALGSGLVDADDRGVRCELDDAGTQLGTLTTFTRRVAALCRALEDARPELPAPALMAHMLPKFRTAARRLGGELDRASMDIDGIRDEMPFALETRWGEHGMPSKTLLVVRPLIPIDGRYRQAWDGETELGPLPEGLEPLAAGADALAIDAESIELVFPPAGSEDDERTSGRRSDLRDLVSRLEGLIAVGLKLSGRAGGYR